MVTVLYTFDWPFMRKSYEAVDPHVGVESAYLPLRPAAVGCCEAIPEVDPDGYDEAAIDAAVRRVDPDVVVRNHRYRPGEFAFDHEYPLVHLRHGASVGRGEVENTVEPEMCAILDVALAPGERWARRYREAFPDRVDVATVGVPEADDLVDADPPDRRRVLYAPTNHRYGGGCYLQTAEGIIDCFAGTEYDLLFRPHPVDRREEPTRSLTERCRERIERTPNVTFDDRPTPGPSMREADLLVSDRSGIVVEWLHADRPMVQLTDLADEDGKVPAIGYRTSIDDLDRDVVDRLYERGYPPAVRRRLSAFLEELGVPMDGRAGRRAAREVVACTR